VAEVGRAGNVRPAPRLGVSRPILLILMTMFLDVLGIGIVLPVTPFYATEFGANALQIGLLFTTYSAAQFLTIPFLGAVSDRFGRRSVLLLSMATEVVAYVAFGLAGNLATLFVARFVAGAGAGNISTAQAYVADVTSPTERTRTFGLVGAAFGVGFLFGPALGGLLSHALDLRAPAFAAGGLVLLNLVLAFLYLPESLPPERRSHKPVISQLNPFGVLVTLLRRPSLRAPLIATFLLNLAFTGLQTNFAVFARDRFGFGPLNVAQVFVVVSLVAILTQGLLVRTLSGRFADEPILHVGIALTVVAFAITGFAWDPLLIWIAFPILAVGSALWRAPLTSLITKLVEATEQGLVGGGSQAVQALGAIGGPIWAGFAYEDLGTAAPYWSGAVIVTIAAVVMLFGSWRPGVLRGRAAGHA
jgi:DHA1 family tetracycline resistance protein-like MFS transporter